ncbi:MAG: cob(I)yrinic acid a,c-diamide adenosyltransferase [Bacteroidetes bacterium]|nr:MAG: cob(I)yrinic acid a,c-diamide adenosyltransferase [Bacteroidota bacterium]
MKIYTKKGDLGETSLFGGQRLSKHHLRIESYGTVDELNAHVGVVRDSLEDQSLRDLLKRIQDTLFVLGGILASAPGKRPDYLLVKEAEIDLLEKTIDEMEETLPPLKSFILPGGHTVVSHCHVARCVCRRAERRVVGLATEEEVDPLVIKYLNRLSDFLFVLSRKIGQDLGVDEVEWKSR